MPKRINTTVSGGLDDKPGRVEQTTNPLAAEIDFNNVPPKMHIDAKAIWKEFVANYPDKAFSNTDRFQLEILCNLMLEYRTSPVNFSSQKVAHLIRILDNFGGSLKSKASLNTTASAEDESSADYLKIFAEDEQ